MTFTKERLEQFINKPLEHGLTRGEQMEMARQMLVSMEREPVAWLHYSVNGAPNFNTNKPRPRKGNSDAIALYTAPPSPVVPAEIRNRFRAEGLAELLKDVRDYAPLTAGQWETLTKNWHQTFVGLSGEGDACHAAMLTDAPQQEAQ